MQHEDNSRKKRHEEESVLLECAHKSRLVIKSLA